MPSKAPVGFFDSGLGGLSILKTVRRLLPYEHICYYGDTANAPYGVRPPEEILRLSRAAAHRLLGEDIKALVIACNTATGVALKALRNELPIPVFGVQPALEEAQRLARGGEILALATPATFKTERYKEILSRHGQGVTSLPCPGLMEYVERMELDGPGLQAFLAQLLEPVKDKAFSVVVLGCTHYPFLQEAIQAFFPGAKMVDDGPRVADELKRALESRSLLNLDAEPGTIRYLSSGGEEAIAKMRKLMEEG